MKYGFAGECNGGSNRYTPTLTFVILSKPPARTISWQKKNGKCIVAVKKYVINQTNLMLKHDALRGKHG